jgi:hypothetical protein
MTFLGTIKIKKPKKLHQNCFIIGKNLLTNYSQTYKFNGDIFLNTLTIHQNNLNTQLLEQSQLIN